MFSFDKVQAGSGLIGGIVGIGTGIQSNEMTQKSIKTANQLNEAAQKRQLKAAANAHQIEVADLKAAGLNPILSAGGSGASSSAGMSGANVYQGRASHMASSAQAANSTMLALKADAEGKISRANAAVAMDVAKATREAAISNAQVAANNARVSGVDADFMDSKYGRAVNAVKRTGEAATAASRPVTDILRAIRGGSSSSAQSVMEPRSYGVKSSKGGDYAQKEDF